MTEKLVEFESNCWQESTDGATIKVPKEHAEQVWICPFCDSAHCLQKVEES